jgi:hypothetical protein
MECPSRTAISIFLFGFSILCQYFSPCLNAGVGFQRLGEKPPEKTARSTFALVFLTFFAGAVQNP